MDASFLPCASPSLKDASDDKELRQCMHVSSPFLLDLHQSFILLIYETPSRPQPRQRVAIAIFDETPIQLYSAQCTTLEPRVGQPPCYSGLTTELSLFFGAKVGEQLVLVDSRLLNISSTWIAVPNYFSHSRTGDATPRIVLLHSTRPWSKRVSRMEKDRHSTTSTASM